MLFLGLSRSVLREHSAGVMQPPERRGEEMFVGNKNRDSLFLDAYRMAVRALETFER